MLHRCKLERDSCILIKHLRKYISSEDLVRYNRKKGRSKSKPDAQSGKAAVSIPKPSSVGSKKLTKKTPSLIKTTASEPAISDSSSEDECVSKVVTPLSSFRSRTIIDIKMTPSSKSTSKSSKYSEPKKSTKKDDDVKKKKIKKAKERKPSISLLDTGSENFETIKPKKTTGKAATVTSKPVKDTAEKKRSAKSAEHRSLSKQDNEKSNKKPTIKKNELNSEWLSPNKDIKTIIDEALSKSGEFDSFREAVDSTNSEMPNRDSTEVKLETSDISTIPDVVGGLDAESKFLKAAVDKSTESLTASQNQISTEAKKAEAVIYSSENEIQADDFPEVNSKPVSTNICKETKSDVIVSDCETNDTEVNVEKPSSDDSKVPNMHSTDSETVVEQSNVVNDMEELTKADDNQIISSSPVKAVEQIPDSSDNLGESEDKLCSVGATVAVTDGDLKSSNVETLLPITKKNPVEECAPAIPTSTTPRTTASIIANATSSLLDLINMCRKCHIKLIDCVKYRNVQLNDLRLSESAKLEKKKKKKEKEKRELDDSKRRRESEDDGLNKKKKAKLDDVDLKTPGPVSW